MLNQSVTSNRFMERIERQKTISDVQLQSEKNQKINVLELSMSQTGRGKPYAMDGDSFSPD